MKKVTTKPCPFSADGECKIRAGMATPTKKFTAFRYLYPPRPESAIAPNTIGFYEKTMQWVAQYKKNGTNTIVAISPSGEIITMNRHAENHKAWHISEYLKTLIRQIFPTGEWHVFVAEVLHSKTKDIKDTLYIYDILVFNSDYLVGSTFIQRQDILDKLLLPHSRLETYSHNVLDDEGKLWYARRFTTALNDLFWSIQRPELDEGLVLKNPEGKLSDCVKERSNEDWQIKVRHSSKKYVF